MEEEKKVTEATVVNETKAVKTKKNEGWPWVPFVAGILTSLLLWQVYTVITKDNVVQLNSDTVAVVNSLEISQTDFEQSLKQTENVATAQGVDVTTEETQQILKEQALEVLINTKILVSAATEAGFTVTEEEIDAQLETIAFQYGGKEGLLEQANQLGLNEEDLREDIGEQIIVDAFLRENAEVEEITVEEAEIEEIYNGLVEAGQQMPPLNDVREGIEAQVLGQKQQAAITEYVNQLREAAEIEILI